MGELKTMKAAVRQLAEADAAYAEDAYYLVHDVVGYALDRQEVPRHLSARELVLALIEYARGEYGPLARPVLSEWGVNGPSDVGKIVYKLIGAKILSASPEDRPEDFLVIADWFPSEDADGVAAVPDGLVLPRIDG